MSLPSRPVADTQLAALERLATTNRSRQADRTVLSEMFGDIPGEEWSDRDMAQFVLRVGAWFQTAALPAVADTESREGELAALLAPYFEKHDDDADEDVWCWKHLPPPSVFRAALRASGSQEDGR